MMAKKNPRYCIQKLMLYDVKQKLENWQTTKYCNDEISAIIPFIPDKGIYRIWDTIENKEVKIKEL